MGLQVMVYLQWGLQTMVWLQWGLQVMVWLHLLPCYKGNGINSELSKEHRTSFFVWQMAHSHSTGHPIALATPLPLDASPQALILKSPRQVRFYTKFTEAVNVSIPYIQNGIAEILKPVLVQCAVHK